MIKYKFFLFILILLTTSCGYHSTHKIDTSKYAIAKFELNGDKIINRLLKRNFKKFSDQKDIKKIYIIKTNSVKKRTIKAKDRLGNSSSFSMNVRIDVEVKDSNKIIKFKSFEEKTNYNNLDNKFELKQYEKIVINDLTNKIVNDINYFLLSIE
tara:strand:- start:1588 stop:2049 length:462 start_codon:yes stop_codon:yes gene_type:complete